MSTLKTTNIQHPSASVPAITLDAAGAMTGSFPSPNRNLLYNSAMQVAQRGTSSTGITGAGYFTADRWTFVANTMGTWTQTVESDAPTGSGLRKSLKVLATTADAAPAAGDYVRVEQSLEGQDLQRIAKGTSSAQQLTLSFWVKSNVTGTYTFFLYDVDNVRMVGAAYTISASATWEKKTITFPADTTGAFDNNNGASMVLYWNLGAGSTRTSGSIQSTWAAYNVANEAVGQTNLAAATNNFWQITGVQLETGAVATPFEFKSYGQELRECQRYYQRWGGDNVYSYMASALGANTTVARALLVSPVTMRAAPNALTFNALGLQDGPTLFSVTNATIDVADKSVTTINLTSSGLTQYRPYQLIANNSLSAYIALSAEL